MLKVKPAVKKVMFYVICFVLYGLSVWGLFEGFDVTEKTKSLKIDYIPGFFVSIFFLSILWPFLVVYLQKKLNAIGMPVHMKRALVTDKQEDVGLIGIDEFSVDSSGMIKDIKPKRYGWILMLASESDDGRSHNQLQHKIKKTDLKKGDLVCLQYCSGRFDGKLIVRELNKIKHKDGNDASTAS